MQKLNKKLFLTIYSIFTMFLLSIMIIFNYQDYKREFNNISNNLNRMANFNKEINEKTESNNNIPPKNRYFMDSVIYTILLDDNNDIKEIINHSDNGNYSNISEEINRIIKKKKTSTKYIGNIYINKYSYSFNNKNYLIIIDNTNTNKRLTNNLYLSIIIFIFFQVIILLITRLITNWISGPVEESFNKQKRFISDSSHELKTPIAVILANAEMIEQNQKNSRWLTNIKNESIKMEKLVKDLLDLTKLEQNNNKALYIKENISKELEKEILVFESLAYENKLKLEYKIDDSIELACNIEEIKRLLRVLLDNAIKHSYKNEIININLFKKKNEIILEVINKGDEIKQEDIEKIFERFYRIDSSRNRDNNRYGLGLSIAKQIVKNHNGKISVSSNNNKTTFKVVFKA